MAFKSDRQRRYVMGFALKGAYVREIPRGSGNYYVYKSKRIGKTVKSIYLGKFAEIKKKR